MLDDFITLVLFLLVLGLLFTIDTILGVLIGTKEEGFNFKKFLYGFLKGGVMAICIAGFCFAIEITPIILKRIDIELPSDIITLAELMGVTLTAYKKYALECFEKIKKLFGE